MKLEKQITAYKFVQDQSELNHFVDWLPEVPENHVYMLYLFARKKYSADSDIPSTLKVQTKLVYSKKDLISKIKRMEVEIGSYKLLKTNKPIDPKSMVFYLELNPTNLVSATKGLMTDLVDLSFNQTGQFKLDKILYSRLAKSSRKKNFIDIDLDDISKSEFLQFLTTIKSYLDRSCLSVIQTRSGYHVLIDTKTLKVPGVILDKHWYNKISQLDVVDEISSNKFIPIPGTVQGGFVPKTLFYVD